MTVGVLRGEELGQEMARLEAMMRYEKGYDACAYVCGINKVGRGSLVGPVAIGAIVLPKGCRILYLNDSKKLLEKCHEEPFLEIKEKAIAWNVDLASLARINEISVLQTTHEAIREIAKGLSMKPGVLLNDAVTVPGLKGVQVPVIRGDAKSLSITTTNVLTKVTRDRIMTKYEELFPRHGFTRYKGYGTAAHIVVTRRPGPYPICRGNFIRNIVQADTYE